MDICALEDVRCGTLRNAMLVSYSSSLHDFHYAQGFASARQASTARPTLFLVSKGSPHIYVFQGVDLPAFLFSYHILDNVPVELREHTRQRLHDDLVFLYLYSSRLLSLCACLPRCCIFSTQSFPLSSLF